MSERKLASIQSILEVQSIKGADFIEIVKVLGWQCVAKKGEFKVGDKVVYIEIDSLLPDIPVFEFMRARKFRVKTANFKKALSQGLVCGLEILKKDSYEVGDDVTEIIGVVKYDPQAALEQRMLDEKLARSNNKIDKYFKKYKWYRSLFMAKKRIGFPAFISKTDETRIQNIPNIIESEKDTEFTVTEKLEGQSGTFYLIKNRKLSKFWKPYIFGVCSRSLELTKEDNSSYWTIARQLNIESVLKEMLERTSDSHIILQGEIIGEGIQKNYYNIEGYDFYAFNLIYSSGKVESIRSEILLERFGIKFVPILDVNFKLPLNVDDLLKATEGESKLYPITREGIVIRNNEKNISFKAVSNNFLLKNEE